MKSFMLLLVFGLVSTEKLDRTYLPPPGSKYAGGDAGDLQAPLEFPKQAYTTVSPFATGQKDKPTSEDTRLIVGIDRGTGLPRLPGNNYINAVTPGNQSPVTYNLPTTTTSYAFTQTTTYPTPEGFETTVSPLPGISPDGSLNIPSAPGTFPQGQEQIFNQQIGGQNQPGYAPERPSPTSGFNIPGSLSPLPGQIITDGRPGYTQNQGFNQYQQSLPSSTISPVSSNLPGQTYRPQGQHLGVQHPLNQQGTLPGSTVAPNYQTNIPSFGNVQGSTTAPFLQPGQYSQQITGQQFPFSPTSQPIQYVDKFGNVQTITTPVQQNPELGGQRPLFGGQQGPLSQSGPQYSDQGTIIPGAVFPTKSSQTPQFINQQPFPTPSSQSTVSIIPTARPSLQVQQTIEQQGDFPSTPGSLVPVQGGQQYQIPGQLSSFASTGVPQPTPGLAITTQPGQQPQLVGQPSSTPTTIIPQGYPSTFQPGSQISGISGSDIPQSSYPGQKYQNLPGTQFLNQQILGPNGQPQYPIGLNSSQLFSTSRPGEALSVYQPGLSDFNQHSFPSSTPAAFPAYRTPPGSILPSPSPGYPSTYQGLSPSYHNLRPERPQADGDQNAVILNYKNELTPEGFAYSFDTSNGIHADENGTAIDGVKAEGSYSYIGDDGNVYNVVYSADENGFRPHGAHLPTPPPVPEAIQRVIEQAAKDREAGIVHDGSYDDTKYGHKKYQGPRRRPQLNDKIVTNGASIPDDDESKFDDGKYIKTPAGKDKIKPIISNEDNNEEDYDDGVRNSDDRTTSKKDQKLPPGRIPSRRPSDRRPEIDGYESEENDDYAQLNSNQRPSGSKTGYKNKYIPERKDSLRRPGYSNRDEKPSRPSEKFDGSQNVDEEPLDESEPFDDDNSPGNRIPTKKLGTKYIGSKTSSQDLPRRYKYKTQTENRRPQDNRKPSAYDSRYENEPDELYTQKFDENGRPTKPSKYPVKSYTTKYSVSGDSDEEYDEESDKPGKIPHGSIRRPQGSNQYDLTMNEQTGQRRPGTIQTEEDYKFSKPNKSGTVTSNQESSYEQKNLSNKYPQQPIDDETGYQYTPPQNKFDQRVTQKFPTRISGTMKYDTTEKKTTVRPFMTPNVYQDEDKSYEEGSNEQMSSKRPGQSKTKTKAPTKVDYETTYDGPEFFDKDIDSELEIGDDEITSTRVYPEQPGLVSSTRRPSYHTKKTSKPEYHFTPSGQDTKQQGYKPDQEYTQQTTGTTRRPGYVSSTTSLPSRRPTYDSKKRLQDHTQREEHIDYQTTYEPSSTANYKNDYFQRNRRPGFSSTSATRKSVTRPGSYPDSTTPSSFGTETGVSSISSSRPTSRPIYDDGTTITDSTTSGRIFDKPTSHPGEYLTNRPARPTTEPDGYFYDKPSSTVSSIETNYPDRIMSTSVTLKPGSTHIPGQTGTTQNLPSTTYRPNYSITDITRPGSVKVNTFGRPISGQPDQVVGNIRPGFSGTSQQGQSLPGTTTVDAYGRPVNQPTYTGQSGANTVSLENQYPPGTVRIDTLGRPINQYDQVINNTSHPGYTVNSGQGQNQPGSVVFDTFGRPVNQLTQPGFPAIPGSVQNEPGVNVDKFGQPVSNLGQPGQVTGSTARPIYGVTSQGFTQPGHTGQVVGSTIRPGLAVSQDTGLPTTAIYQNSGVNIPGQSKDTFKPSEAFGSTTPGPRPAEFGPSNVRTPAYLGPYPSTTERVKGEDFSGPKQPQKFDPNTGYHY